MKRTIRVRGTKDQRGVRGIGGARYKARAQLKWENEMLEREGRGFFYSAILTFLFHVTFHVSRFFHPHVT